MERNGAAQAFSTLGHPGPHAVFRLLMRFAPQGMRPTEIARALGMKQNTLSHHLADLTASGVVRVTRVGRSLYYAVDLGTTGGLIGYLALDVGRARPGILAPLVFCPNGRRPHGPEHPRYRFRHDLHLFGQLRRVDLCRSLAQ